MNVSTNPRAVIGANKPPLITLEQLTEEYGRLEAAVKRYEALGADAPHVVEDEEDLAIITDLSKKGVAAIKAIEAIRKDVKDPYLDAERVVQSFFISLISRLDAIKTSVEGRGTVYQRKKLDAERRKREEQAANERREAEAKAEEARCAREAAAEATKQNSAADAAAALEAVEAAKAAEIAAVHAGHKAAFAEAEANATPADMVRSHSASGTASLAVRWEHTIENFNLVDINLLRPYMTAAEMDKWIRAYIKAGQHLIGTNKLKDPDGKGGLAGVVIYDASKGLYR